MQFLFLAVLGVHFLWDLIFLILPDELTISLLAFSRLFCHPLEAKSLYFCWGIYLLYRVLPEKKKAQIGYGDLKLLFFFSSSMKFSDLWQLITYSFILGALVSLICLVKGDSLKKEIPLGSVMIFVYLFIYLGK